MQALCLYAGPKALRSIARSGLAPSDIHTIPGVAGGPKGLILGPLDRFLFGEWLAPCARELHLVGASIGAWRMATACLDDPLTAFKRLEHDYIRQHYELAPCQTRPAPETVSELFGESLRDFYGTRTDEVLAHPRRRLHIVTARGRHLLGREHRLRTPLGYAGAFLTNSLHRRAMGAWLERVVFSTAGAELPFLTTDYRTRKVNLTLANFHLALQASCSIPFVLRAVHDIPGAPAGAYWDGGITDYHLHLNFSGVVSGAAAGVAREQDSLEHAATDAGLVLYPHFQRAVVPGWLDKGLKWRHKSTHFLDTTLLLAPNPDWVKTLPNAKLPDRQDFLHYGRNLAARVRAWSTAAAASEQLADEFAQCLRAPDTRSIQPI